MENFDNQNQNNKNPVEKSKGNALVDIYKQIEKHTDETLKQKIKIHWFLVIFAILLTFLFGFINEVPLFDNLERCFYVGAIFWIIAEVIDYILKG
jgi:hypothetical protein